NGLKEAFDAARAGDDDNPALKVLEDMFRGMNLGATATCSAASPQTPCGPVGSVGSNGVLQTAGMHLRGSTSFQTNLANGNYQGLAATLNTLNYAVAVNPTLPALPAQVLGQVLRQNGLFPENFIVANPQFSSVNLMTNNISNNYHSFAAQVTLRPLPG